MRIAVRTTLVMLILYVVALGGLAFLVERDLRSSVRDVMENTAHLVGNEVAAALHESVMKQLLEGDREASKELKETIGTLIERSDIVTSIDVINKAGQIVASDNEELVGSQFARPGDVFQQERKQRLISSFELFGIGKHTLLVPLIQEGELLGYLQLTLSNQPIAGLYDRVYLRLLLAALLGLVAIIGLGLLLQLELGRLDKNLTSLLEAALGHGDSSQVAGFKEFSRVRGIASKVSAELREARNKADLAWRELDALARVLKVGVMLLGPEGKREFVSDAAVELVAGHQIDQLDDRMQDIWGDLELAMNRMQKDSMMATTVELELPAEGAPRHLRFELYAIDPRDWRGCLVLIKDRDVIDALDTDLRAATRFRGLASLYMGAAHDLKAPLNAMVMNLELLKRTFHENSHANNEKLGRQEQYAGVLTEQLARLNRFLNALLEQTAPSVEGRSATDLRELIEKLNTLLAPQARLQQVTFATELPDRPVSVVVYPGQLQQALLNIAINALEAMPRGGKLNIRVQAEAGLSRLSVCDTGPGIPSPLLSKIFDMHFTTKNTGTGIGLYVTRAIVERNGGKLEVDTRLGEGTCFHIILPMEQEGAETPSRPQEERDSG